MLDKQDLFTHGLCIWINELCYAYHINYDERDILHDYIHTNRVSKYQSIDAYKHRNQGYWWERGNIKPRIKWIKKHIAKLKNIEK